MWRSAITALRRYSRRLPPSLADHPLLDGTRLRELALQAASLPASLLEFRRPPDHPLIGETLSAYRGRGFEFEENRAYQPGDEPRLLNWRLYARAGALYTKVFSEERRPQVFLVLDRRAAMRFGTRRRLKVTLAAEIGLLYAFQARQQGYPLGGLILDRELQWLEPRLGEGALQDLVQAVTAPCPPLAFQETGQPDVGQALQLLLHRLPGGSCVVLLSDFADLDPASATPLLHQLASRHTVQAVQVLDPVEMRLPEDGDFLLDDGDPSHPLRIDGRDAVQRRRYREAFEARQAALADAFARCAIALRTCSTLDEPTGGPGAGGGHSDDA